MKKILFIYNKPENKPIPQKQQHHFGWVKDCRKQYNIKYWGNGFSDIGLASLNREIDSFRPDFIYMTMRKRYKIDRDRYWLPDLTNITVPKIFVECDSYKWNRTDDWYNQFDEVYCRQAWWKPVFYSRNKIIHPKFVICAKTWNKVPVFKWSVPEIAFSKKNKKRNGIYFMGSVTRRGYTDRKMMWLKIKNRVKFCKIFGSGYWKLLHTSSALICPTESNYGSFVPSKLFEFLASGAAVLTNCDLDLYGTPEFKPFIINYTNINSLEEKIKTKFEKYHNKAINVMRNHTHKVRYKELFG